MAPRANGRTGDDGRRLRAVALVAVHAHAELACVRRKPQRVAGGVRATDDDATRNMAREYTEYPQYPEGAPLSVGRRVSAMNEIARRAAALRSALQPRQDRPFR